MSYKRRRPDLQQCGVSLSRGFAYESCSLIPREAVAHTKSCFHELLLEEHRTPFNSRFVVSLLEFEHNIVTYLIFVFE
jgi:hypothetical protein